MQTTIAPYDHETRSVTVVFEHAGVVHVRPVNACRGLDQEYDADATAARVAEVAKGVQRKIELGVITNPLPEPETPAENR